MERSAPNLLFLQTSSIHEKYGGIESYIEDLYHSARDLCQGKVTAIVAQRAPLQKLQSPPYQTEFVPLPSHPLLGRIANRFSWSLFSTALKKSRATLPTAIINTHVSLGPLAHLLHLKLGIPYVTIAYGIESWGSLYPQDEWCLRHSAHILSISEWTRDILIRRGYPKEKISVIHPCLPTHFQDTPEKSYLRNGKLVLLSISRLDAKEQYKGQDHVLKAMAQMRKRQPKAEIEYWIQGEGDDKPRLKDLVDQWDLNSQVQFLPAFKERSELESLYRKADVFILPSRFGFWNKRWHGEGFGIVYVEAAAWGVPSIAYNCGGAVDIIENGSTGLLVPPDDIDALEKAIFSLVETPEKIRSLGQAARTHVKEKFSFSQMHQQLGEALSILKAL